MINVTDYYVIKECLLTNYFITALQIINILQIGNSFILLLVYPIELFVIIVTLAGFYFLKNWHNPAKIYYYSISIFNFIGFLFQDFTWTFAALFGMISTNWIHSLYIPNLMKPIFNSNVVICPVFFYLRDIGPLFQYWAISLFAIHRMLIVLFPLKTHIIQKLFNKVTFISTMLLVGCFYIPDFYVVQMYQGKYCVLMTFASDFWRVYYGQLIYLENIVPLIIICISVSIISYCMKKAANRRLQFTSTLTCVNFHRHGLLEKRSTLISMTISVVYLICVLPYAVSVIVLSFLNSQDCFAPTYKLATVLVDLNSILEYEQIILRAADGIVFFLMIPDFRRSVLNIFHCRIPTYSNAAFH